MTIRKTIVFFPSPAALGPCLNLIGIAQRLSQKGYRSVFVVDPLMAGPARSYGLEEYLVPCLLPISADELAQRMREFEEQALLAFRTTPLEQIDTYVRACMEAGVESVSFAERGLAAAFSELRPDLIVKDNATLYPATEMAGCPWVRVISCCESELPDPDIPPFASGCHVHDKVGFAQFQARFAEVIRPIHDRFNEVVVSTGHPALPWPEFQLPSPHLNLLLYPENLRYHRRNTLDPQRFHYLNGCLRQDDAPVVLPTFQKYQDRPLIYVGFGSIGAAEIDVMKRLISALGKLPYRVLVAAGQYQSAYSELPENVQVTGWCNQIGLLPHCDVVIQHGGNNTLNETLYFGKPPIVMPFTWDGHDNAARVADTQHGIKLHRYAWTEEELCQAIERVLVDPVIRRNIERTSRHMQASDGCAKAARLIDEFLCCEAGSRPSQSVCEPHGEAQ